jgi:hypothetical protein
VGAILNSIGRAIGTGSGARQEVVVLDIGTGQRIGAVALAIHPHLSPNGQTLAVRDRSLAVELFELPTPIAEGLERRPPHEARSAKP